MTYVTQHRNKSPSKTETQDIYRTFIDQPEVQAHGGAIFNEQAFDEPPITKDDTGRQVQQSTNRQEQLASNPTVASPSGAQEALAQIATPAERKTVTIM